MAPCPFSWNTSEKTSVSGEPIRSPKLGVAGGSYSRPSFGLSLERNPTDFNVLKAWSSAQVRGGNYVRWDWTVCKGSRIACRQAS
jgi:hypothetical protein